jgi:tetratricopeptide (TPR) repeat protein
VKRPATVRTRHHAQRQPDAVARSPVDRFKVVYIVVSALVVCSMLAVALTTIDFGGSFSEDDGGSNIENPNADLIAEQETAVAGNPENVDQIVLLANLLGNTGQIQKAIPWYEKALSLAPDDHGVRLDFARSLASANLHTDAEAQFARVLENDPENQTAHYYVAELYMAWSPPKQEKALEHYERAVELDPTSFLGERAHLRIDSLRSPSPVASLASSPQTQGP